MDFIWILIAYVFGFAFKQLGFPPLIGYLIAGFALHAYGLEADSLLQTLGNLGVTLLLFTIGLKIQIKDLTRIEVWGGTLFHMGLWVAALTGVFSLLSISALPYFTDLTLESAAIIAFALSFSSTVCIVKLLEDSGEMKTRHGKLAIGILVMQDIAAVLFLVFAKGQLPTVWALGLLLLVFSRPLFNWILSRSGHGEMLPLTGFLLAFGGYELFELVGMKGDLGALVFGVLLAQHVKSGELAKALLSFKDLFLIGFFLAIGFTALPTVDMMLIAVGLCSLLLVKALLYFGLLTALKLRGRTSYLSGLSLMNFSEFGLIVMVLSVDAGWLDNNWLVIVALAVSISFVITSMTYKGAHSFYARHKSLIRRYERSERLNRDIFCQPPNAEILVIGLGRVGQGAYKALHKEIGDRVCGIDADNQTIKRLTEEGLPVVLGDAEDADFWDNLNLDRVKLVMLALPSIEDMQNISEQLQLSHYKGSIAGIARYVDEQEILRESGIDHVFNFFAEAGSGFAEESLKIITPSQQTA
ncbi:cation:proton antiporter family protein [Litoribrevibacter albus]|uniref:Potassium transporter Kef n=1 Tax=Litoribrevibacter albus TaxID=1473156 RepID=A0AA37W8C8_9GAMM|nr:cation:proton antiporter family protein [Litoribrevibacter albus]GLQ32278.1 potassium transporter Kef [Litoribrevibacter albus]